MPWIKTARTVPWYVFLSQVSYVSNCEQKLHLDRSKQLKRKFSGNPAEFAKPRQAWHFIFLIIFFQNQDFFFITTCAWESEIHSEIIINYFYINVTYTYFMKRTLLRMQKQVTRTVLKLALQQKLNFSNAHAFWWSNQN